jgi:hypothetical protein
MQEPNERRLTRVAPTQIALFLLSANFASLGTFMRMQGHGKPMEREVAHYRGYRVEGENDEHSWLLRVQPAQPNLPILWLSSFRVVEPTWDRALGEAHTHIDAMLGEHESLQAVGSRHKPPTEIINPPRYVPPELELIFNSVWEVIRPQGTVRPHAEAQLRLALARRLLTLSTQVTEARELRRQAIEHFLLNQ